MDTIQGIVTGIPDRINKGGSSLSVWQEIQITGGECPVFRWYCLYTKTSHKCKEGFTTTSLLERKKSGTEGPSGQ